MCSDIWNVPYIELRILKPSKLWSSQLWTQFKQLRIEAWKSQDFNGFWTRDLAIPVRRSNQLSYEATDNGSWSFVSSNEPVNSWFPREYLISKSALQYMEHFIYNFTNKLELKRPLCTPWMTPLQAVKFDSHTHKENNQPKPLNDEHN